MYVRMYTIHVFIYMKLCLTMSYFCKQCRSNVTATIEMTITITLLTAAPTITPIGMSSAPSVSSTCAAIAVIVLLDRIKGYLWK